MSSTRSYLVQYFTFVFDFMFDFPWTRLYPFGGSHSFTFLCLTLESLKFIMAISMKLTVLVHMEEIHHEAYYREFREGLLMTGSNWINSGAQGVLSWEYSGWGVKCGVLENWAVQRRRLSGD